MAIEYPPLLTFEHILTFSFPGIFSTVPLLLVCYYFYSATILIWIKDFDKLIALLGFIILIGTIFGIIIDGVAEVIKNFIFNNNQYIRDINEYTVKMKIKTRTKLDVDGLTKLDKYFTEGSYTYSKFYYNAFLSLIPNCIIIPIYLKSACHFADWYIPVDIGLVLFILSLVCFHSGYKAYVTYLTERKVIYKDLYTNQSPTIIM